MHYVVLGKKRKIEEKSHDGINWINKLFSKENNGLCCLYLQDTSKQLDLFSFKWCSGDLIPSRMACLYENISKKSLSFYCCVITFLILQILTFWDWISTTYWQLSAPLKAHCPCLGVATLAEQCAKAWFNRLSNKINRKGADHTDSSLQASRLKKCFGARLHAEHILTFN